MFSYKFYIKESGNALMLRVTKDRIKAELAMGYSLTAGELEQTMSGRPAKKHAALASTLILWQGKIEGIKLNLNQTVARKNITAKNIRDLIRAELFGEPVTFKPDPDKIYFEQFFDQFGEGHQTLGTRKIYRSTLKAMQKFDADLSTRAFEDITLRWLTDFEAFLSKTEAQNTRNIHLRNIRAAFNRANAEEITSVYPFKRIKLRAAPTAKRSFSVEEIRKLFACDDILDPWEVKYMDFFRLLFMLVGINVVDLCNAKAKDIIDGRLVYTRAKTHKLYNIKLEPEAIAIIEKYKGEEKLLSIVETYANYRHFYANFCKAMKSIKHKLGLPELTSYWARHTWATIAYELDVSETTIAQALGHSSAHRVTEVYIRRNPKKVDDANRRVLDAVLYNTL